MIYRLDLNTEKFAGIYVDHDEFDCKMGDLLYPEGVDLEDEWVTPDGILYDAKGKEREGLEKPDIASWVGNLTFSESAYHKICECLTPFGQFLKININKSTWYVLNIILKTLNNDVIDQDYSERDMSGGIYMGSRKLKFLEEKLTDTLLFRIKYDECVGQFCNEDFKKLIENNNLSGVVFRMDLE